ncbi:hypothetical protein QD357_01870 [Rhizobium sp. BR 317]|uniref:hypothetical protein n=1 Tax=Rhizobium sp. BR 317 TaxID=3040015 RepID=UPI0039BF0F17
MTAATRGECASVSPLLQPHVGSGIFANGRRDHHLRPHKQRAGHQFATTKRAVGFISRRLFSRYCNSAPNVSDDCSYFWRRSCNASINRCTFSVA